MSNLIKFNPLVYEIITLNTDKQKNDEKQYL